MQVDYIFESEDIFRRFFHGFKPTLTMDDHKIELLQQQNGIILEELKVCIISLPIATLHVTYECSWKEMYTKSWISSKMR